MSAAAGPEIVNDGLVFAYDVANGKSYKGAPTTNILPQPLSFSTGYTYEAWTGSIIDNSEVAPDGTLTATAVTRTGGYFYKRNTTAPTFTVSPGDTITWSCWVRALDATDHSGTGIWIWCYDGAGGGPRANSTQTITTEWTRLSVTYTALAAETSFAFGFLGSSAGHLKGSVAIWHPLLEKHPFATPFVDGTRSTTQSLYDLTGNNTITAARITPAANNTFEFNGSDTYVSYPVPITSSASYTVLMWAKPNVALGAGTSSANRRTPLVGPGPVWNPGIWVTSVNIRVHSASDYVDVGISWPGTTWKMIGMVYNGTSSSAIVDDSILSGTVTAYSPSALTTMYMGAENSTGNAYNWNGELPLTIFYNRALTAAEVKQNFEAMRSRFGI